MINTLEELFQSNDGQDDVDEGDNDPDLKDEALLKINLHVSIYSRPQLYSAMNVICDM